MRHWSGSRASRPCARLTAFVTLYCEELSTPSDERSDLTAVEICAGAGGQALGLEEAGFRTLPGRPDIVFPAARVVVFVDGDFWHARAVRETSLSTVVATFPRRSYRYWQNKFAARIERDDKVSEELMRGGWHVIRIWESELRLNFERQVKEIAHQVRARSS